MTIRPNLLAVAREIVLQEIVECYDEERAINAIARALQARDERAAGIARARGCHGGCDVVAAGILHTSQCPIAIAVAIESSDVGAVDVGQALREAHETVKPLVERERRGERADAVL